MISSPIRCLNEHHPIYPLVLDAVSEYTGGSVDSIARISDFVKTELQESVSKQDIIVFAHHATPNTTVMDQEQC